MMRLFTKREITGKDGSVYLTRYELPFGYALHVFERGDEDPDCHDHPWDFWTLPLTPYVEEVWSNGELRYYNLVTEGVWHFRPATYTHRVRGPRYEYRFNGKATLRDVVTNIFRDPWIMPWYTRLCWHIFGISRIVTIVKRGPVVRKWGFQKKVDGSYIWTPGRKYLEERDKS